MKKIGILTGGGDCPGLNAVIRSVVERCAMQDVKVFGYHEGWRGVIEQDGHWMDTAEVESGATYTLTTSGTTTEVTAE